METVLSRIPAWLPAYWVGVTVVRLVISVAVVLIYGRTAPIQKPANKTWGIGLISVLLIVWVGLTIRLGSLNFFQIEMSTPLPPLIAPAALIPIIAGYVAFQYWETFRRIIFNIPQHWLIGLQAYRMTGGVFLIVYALGLIPGVFALTAGIGDFVTGALVIPVAYFYYQQKPWSRKVALGWNYLGLVELIILIPFGLLSSPSRIQMLALDAPNYLTSTWPSVLAPTFHVPLGILMHLFSLALLRQEAPTRVKTTLPKIAWQLMLVSTIAVSAYVALFYIFSPLVAGHPIAFQVYPGLGQILAAHPVSLYIHIIPAALALVLGPLQFLPSIRSKHLNVHRWMGRTYLFVGVLWGGLGALYLAQFSFAGLGSQLGFSTQAILLLFTGYMAYTNIRQKRVDTHREWMMRNYALVFGAVTLRLYIRTFFWLGYDLPDFHAINAWLCWIPNLIFAEWLIYRIRAQREEINPALQVTSSQP